MNRPKHKNFNNSSSLIDLKARTNKNFLFYFILK